MTHQTKPYDVIRLPSPSLISQCFKISQMGSTRYHKLTHTDNPEVVHYVDCLEKGVFDALNQGYLDKVLLEVFSRKPGPRAQKGKNTHPNEFSPEDISSRIGELLECFSFTVGYGDDGPQVQVGWEGKEGSTSRPSGLKQDIKDSSRNLLEELFKLTETLEPLPKETIVSMKVWYSWFFSVAANCTLVCYVVPQLNFLLYALNQILHKEHTPEDYMPPHFVEATEEHQGWFDEHPIRVRAGNVSTPFHRLNMTIRARASRENEKARVLRKEHMSMRYNSEETETIIDVGGSQGNSGRAGVPQKTVRETQEVLTWEETYSPIGKRKNKTVARSGTLRGNIKTSAKSRKKKDKK